MAIIQKLVGLVSATACVLVSVTVASCASAPPHVSEYLDPTTGATVSSASVPLILYRENPATAAYARNFVQIGPIEVNRSGDYQYFLWVGAWNTMQPADPVRYRDGLEAITVIADGEPLSLELAGWLPESIGTSRPVYAKPVASSTDAFYRVTMDQIRLIASANDLMLRTSGPTPREYQLWDRQGAGFASLSAFLESVY